MDNTCIDMENLEIQGQLSTFFTPSVNFSAETGICELSGESYLEDAFQFYDILMNWVNQYFEEGNNELEMNIRLTYFNTSSSRAILDLLRLLKNYQDSRDYKVIVNWYYPNLDYDEMKAEAEDYIDETGLSMNLIPYAV
ncbi:MAG: DUF1987 domain-containing protein [Thermoflexibacter sp.]